MAALNKKSVDDINVKGKRVLVRCDFNVPLQDGKITDENRIVAALPTIKKLIADGGKVILCSHLGKPKGEPKHRITFPPSAISFLIVGSAATRRFSSVICPSFKGTLKSQRTKTFFPATLMSSTDFLLSIVLPPGYIFYNCKKGPA